MYIHRHNVTRLFISIMQCTVHQTSGLISEMLGPLLNDKVDILKQLESPGVT